MRVLVVEDHAELADDIADGLRDQGIGADVAYDGPTAVADPQGNGDPRGAPGRRRGRGQHRGPAGAAQSQTSVELADLLVTRYPPGARIGWYRDAPQLGEVGGVSLPAACRMRFRRGRARALGGDSLRRGRTPQAGPDRARRRAPSAGGLTGSAPRRDHGKRTPRSSFARRRRHQSPGPERSSRRGRRLEGYPRRPARPGGHRAPHVPMPSW